MARPPRDAAGVSLVSLRYDLLSHAIVPEIWCATGPPVDTVDAEALAAWAYVLQANGQPNSRPDMRHKIENLMWELSPLQIEGVVSPTLDVLDHIDVLRDCVPSNGGETQEVHDQNCLFMSTDVHPFHR